jgi:hypothetical protein
MWAGQTGLTWGFIETETLWVAGRRVSNNASCIITNWFRTSKYEEYGLKVQPCMHGIKFSVLIGTCSVFQLSYGVKVFILTQAVTCDLQFVDFIGSMSFIYTG